MECIHQPHRLCPTLSYPCVTVTALLWLCLLQQMPSTAGRERKGYLKLLHMTTNEMCVYTTSIHICIYTSECINYRVILCYLFETFGCHIAMDLHVISVRKTITLKNQPYLWYIHAHCGLYMHTVVYTCTLWYIHVHCGIYMYTVVYTCTLRYIHVHCGIYMYTVVYTCTLRYIHVHCGIYMYTVVYTRTLRYLHIHCGIYLFIYCHLYSAFSIVQCSNALYRL